VPSRATNRHGPAQPERGPLASCGVDVRWRTLDEDDVWNGRTRAGRTVIDCAKDLPFDEALTVADSALRHGNVTHELLLSLADRVASTGRAQCQRVAREGSGRAANPFESVLRAIASDVAGLDRSRRW